MKCSFCSKDFPTSRSLINHQTKCPSNPDRHVIEIKDKAAFTLKMKEANKIMWTDAARSKLGFSMKKAHNEGRAYNIGSNRWKAEPSYPEKFFAQIIINEFDDKQVTKEHPFGRYSLDFAWLHLKRVIEVDGKQHEQLKQRASDARKDKALQDAGWQVLRVKWSDMCSNTQYEIARCKEFIGSKL